MRKLFIAPLTAALLLAAMAVPVAARGPACVDLLSESSTTAQPSRAAYDGARVAAQLYLAKEQCRQATYTLYVLDNDGDTEVIASAAVQGDGSDDSVEIFVDVDVEDTDVCAYVESSIGRHVFDRAPADGCVTLFDDGTTPAGGKGF